MPSELPEPEESEKLNYSKMTKTDLLAYCTENNIDVTTSMTKAQIIAAIEEAESEQNSDNTEET